MMASMSAIAQPLAARRTTANDSHQFHDETPCARQQHASPAKAPPPRKGVSYSATLFDHVHTAKNSNEQGTPQRTCPQQIIASRRSRPRGRRESREFIKALITFITSYTVLCHNE
ncbi:hypothetical protein AVEN_128717-1 [Araneus ventricosus]|uniref:Uncharacterized protein n=1 Tax=Araneus ventricosus TaxID=182803 RepID=A0A4Y2QX39_ARAVE|nr:hypothetical protein AVEN_128717-1 [Araneus ventricosus]